MLTLENKILLWEVQNLQVKVVEYGFSENYARYYVTYKVTDLNAETLSKLKDRLKDPVKIVCNDLYLTTYFEEEYYPFKSEDSQKNPEDFVAREEIEMLAYIIDLLEG